MWCGAYGSSMCDLSERSEAYRQCVKFAKCAYFLVAITDNTYSDEHPEFIYEGVMHQCIHNDTLCIEL